MRKTGQTVLLKGNFIPYSLNETADLLKFIPRFRGKLCFPLPFINMMLR